MRIHNLNAPHEAMATPASPVSVSEEAATPAAVSVPASLPVGDAATQIERQALEIAFLKARIQHLELVLETARSLMGSNHERLLRRLHELPREIVDLSAQLRRVDPNAAW